MVSPWMLPVIAGLRASLVMSHLCLRAQTCECGPAVGKGGGGGVEEGKEGGRRPNIIPASCRHALPVCCNLVIKLVKF